MLMLEATTSRSTGFSMSASNRVAVPTVFTRVYSASLYILCPTPTSEAK